ncbi:acyl carrier protein [Terriglobus aquaticus]|uniref:Acyl carrier protein n=1 Tax=Terriglobus aquaticus TaxID=940139 RepID=A0ABW9KIB4_9BACT|nr:acyl carrier protein [Terriglobus aquaticus]
MDNPHLYRELTEIFREVFDDDTLTLTPETTAADIDGWDSMAHIGLIVAIEERMGVKFNSAELESLHNVGQLAGVLEYKLESRQVKA